MRTGTLWMGAIVLVLAAGCNRNDIGSDRDRQAGNITLTGCLQAGEQGLASREPNAASRSAENIDRFVLANAKMPGSAASSTDSPGPLYVLEGEADDLRQHVGQQVEITGKPEEADPNQGNARRLEVESVRMIAANCVTP